jgi:glycosyltransferase involved in cell wall biosynthesis
MNIGIIIGRIGGVDGVALETGKWIEVLRAIGHSVYTLSGQYQERPMERATETILPELSFSSPESFWSQKRAFFFPESDPGELIGHVRHHANALQKKIEKWIADNHIDLLISENASSLPSHLEMGLAIKQSVQHLGIPTITHDHDFAWDRGDRYISSHPEINRFVEEVFPLRAENAIHAVINSHASVTLNEKFGRDSVLVPNVMDFSKPFGIRNAVSESLVTQLGFEKEDILLFQITKILRRKGIDVAIRLIDALHDSRVKLVVTGNYPDDAGSAYYTELVNLIHELRLGDRVIFAHHLFHGQGFASKGDEVDYSLSDAYACATACTYFSSYEGFGNAFLEAVLARKPVFVNNYEPVFMPDIGSKGFHTVMIEHGNLSEEAVRKMAEVIYNPALAKAWADHNYELGKKYFSYDTLRQKLELIIELSVKKAVGN